MESKEFKSNFSETWPMRRASSAPPPTVRARAWSRYRCRTLTFTVRRRGRLRESSSRRLHEDPPYRRGSTRGGSWISDSGDLHCTARPAGGRSSSITNPHGSEWRRWSHNNMDLNRNNGIGQLDFMERRAIGPTTSNTTTSSSSWRISLCNPPPRLCA